MRHIPMIYGLVGLGFLLGWFPFGPMYYGVPWHNAAIKWGVLLGIVGYLLYAVLFGGRWAKRGGHVGWFVLGFVSGLLALLIMVEWLHRI